MTYLVQKHFSSTPTNWLRGEWYLTKELHMCLRIWTTPQGFGASVLSLPWLISHCSNFPKSHWSIFCWFIDYQAIIFEVLYAVLLTTVHQFLSWVNLISIVVDQSYEWKIAVQYCHGFLSVWHMQKPLFFVSIIASSWPKS